MNSLEKLEKIIDFLKATTEYNTQGKVSAAAGFKNKTLSEYKSKEGGPDLAIKQLELAFSEQLKNSTYLKWKSPSKKMPIENALERRVADLESNVQVLQEYIAKRVAEKDKVSDESVYFELNKLKAGHLRREEKRDIQTDLGIKNKSARRK